MKGTFEERLAGIEYAGLAGISKGCQDAVMRLLQYGDQVTHVRILTDSKTHCLLLTINVGDLVAVKSGFSSGYSGEGPHTFSYVLQLLESHGAEIEEFDVAKDVIERLDSSALTKSDLVSLDAANPVRPSRWYDYVSERDWEKARAGDFWREFEPVVPFAIIDTRITDLAISFWQDPDDRLLTGYRRLEDTVRKRTRIDEHGAKLFSRAFLGPSRKLGWKDLGESEHEGRSTLFVAAYKAFRNPRAHRERHEYRNQQLAEFLLLNHLFMLEKEAHRVGKKRPERG